MSVEQLDIYTQPHVAVQPAGRGTPQQRWDAFVAANPTIRRELVATTRQLIDAGKRATIARCWEEMRERVWTTGSEWRLDNSMRAPAAAWLRDTHPDLAVNMRTRRARR